MNDESTDNDTLPQEDRVLFGTKTFAISDKLMDAIDAALVEGVSSLPRLPKEEALLQMLRKVYVRNVNLLEAYMARNIFSIQSLPPSRRRKVVEAFVTNTLPEIPDIPDNKENIMTSSVEYPTSDQIPSQEELTKAEQELKDLRVKLAELKRHRTELGATMEQLAIARRTIPLVPADVRVHDKVTKLFKAKETLEDLTSKAKEVTAKLDDEKKNRNDEDDAPAIPKKRKLGLVEAYEEESTNITLEGLQNMKQFLKQQ